MQIVLTPEGILRLNRPSAFNEFEILVPAKAVPLPSALVQDDELHAWVSEAWLRAELERSALAEGWQREYQSMLDYACRKGWLRADPLAIRAHVVRGEDH